MFGFGCCSCVFFMDLFIVSQYSSSASSTSIFLLCCIIVLFFFLTRSSISTSSLCFRTSSVIIDFSNGEKYSDSTTYLCYILQNLINIQRYTHTPASHTRTNSLNTNLPNIFKGECSLVEWTLTLVLHSHSHFSST